MGELDSQPIMSMDPFHEGQQTFEQEADHLEHQSGVILQGAVCLFLLWGWMEEGSLGVSPVFVILLQATP